MPKPDWGGYRVVPSMVEFWQGQSNRWAGSIILVEDVLIIIIISMTLFRIHDRLRFRKPREEEEMDSELFVKGDQGWVIERLAP